MKEIELILFNLEILFIKIKIIYGVIFLFFCDFSECLKKYLLFY